ncbi:MAG: aminoacetone oxidase family FAD-binding enzyme [Lachnospiraceae bacterium]|nr:aminoacetone oxidase family FAD-binding enzyme [Lachnospiraceae bacterium]
MKHTGIIGGGASGMMAAIAAANAGALVTILESKDRIGKKILATGNGKCNLSNLDFCVERDYRGNNTEKLKTYFDQFSVNDTIRFFNDRGMLLTDRGGYLYPRCNQASAVLDLFRSELAFLGVNVICGCRILDIQNRNGFLVKTQDKTYRFDSLILACGTKAGTGKKDAVDGFSMAKKLGLKVYEPLPALTALHCKEAFFKALAGVRCQALVKLIIQDNKRESIYEESGEMQLTDYGISGIPVFQLSRYASKALESKQKVRAVINFLPEISDENWPLFCKKQFEAGRQKSVEMLGNGMIHKKAVQVLLKQCNLRGEEIVSDKNRKRIFDFFESMRHLQVEVCGINPVENAQICMGGVSLQEVNENLESHKYPGLYLCGEMLDVDGRCGGYNLQWAWTSGYIAGSAGAAKK